MHRCSPAGPAGVFFPPARVFFELGPENYSPVILRKIVYFGGNSHSFQDAERNIRIGADFSISSRHIETLTNRMGSEMTVERDHLAKLWEEHQMPPSTFAGAPQAVAVSADDGKVRIRANDQGPGVHDPNWRNSKVGLLMTVQSQQYEQDPAPDPPRAFTKRKSVEKLVRELGHSRANPKPLPPPDADDTSQTPKEKETKEEKKKKNSPKILVRSCIATHTGPKTFGDMLAAEAHQRRFFEAIYKVFLGDGSHGNWTIQEMYFPLFLALLDFVHLTEHLVDGAKAAAKVASLPDWWPLYLELVNAAWSGKPQTILDTLGNYAELAGPVPTDASKNDPGKILAGAIGYVENNKERMDYPRARRLGLPVTTSHVESLINEFNIRVKGAGKFWCSGNVESVLQVRTALLSTTARWDTFWKTRARKHAGRIRPPRRSAA